MTQLGGSPRPVWRKSSRSEQQGECVEFADLEGAVGVRDSKDPSGPQLRVTRGDWARFLASVKNL